jgi:ParB-like chromosome segregation protein Spo0J
MQEAVKVAFEQQVVMIPRTKILPSRVLAPEIKERVKYKRIVASVLQLGLIEPLVV